MADAKSDSKEVVVLEWRLYEMKRSLRKSIYDKTFALPGKENIYFNEHGDQLRLIGQNNLNNVFYFLPERFTKGNAAYRYHPLFWAENLAFMPLIACKERVDGTFIFDHVSYYGMKMSWCGCCRCIPWFRYFGEDMYASTFNRFLESVKGKKWGVLYRYDDWHLD